ncbi:MAG: caspase family protein [Pyrinomonadaceae bacterium]|nr:caspase family protein [Pyrinomonadaceae bacterium]
MTLRRILLSLLTGLLFLSTNITAQQPELYVRTNHADVVRCVAVSPNGKMAASGSADGTVRLWDVQTGMVMRTLSGHSGTVFSLLFVTNETLLAGSTREIKPWNVKTGRSERELKTERTVYSMAISPDSKILAYATIGRVVLLDLAEKKERELKVAGKEPTRVAFRPTQTGAPMLAASFGNLVVLYDAQTGAELGVAEHVATASVKAVAFSPDGKMLATCGTDFWYIWNVETKGSLFRGRALGYGAAFSPDSKTFVVAGNDIELWDLETGKRKTTLEIKNNLIESIVYSPDGKFLIGGGYQSIEQTNSLEASFKILDAHTGTERDIKAIYTTALEAIALSPDGKILASGSADKKIRLWNLASGQIDMPLGDMTSTVVDLAFSADSKLLASTGLMDRVRFWDMTKRSEFIPGEDKKKAESKKQPAPKPKPTPKPAATPQKDADDNPAEQMIGALDKMLDAVSRTNWGTPTFSADGKKFATLESGNRLALRDVKTWEPQHLLAGHQSEVYTAAFSHDGKLLASGSDDGLTKIWDTATGTEVRTLSKHRMSVRSLAFSTDDTMLATGSNDSTIKLWDVATGRLLRTLSGYGAYVRSVVFSADGKKLINGGLANKAHVWDVATGRLLRSLAGHHTDVQVVIYSPDGKFLFTCSKDGTTKVWRESDGAELATLILLGDGDWLVVTPDGLFDGSPVAWQQIFWRFGDTYNTAPVEAFFADFFYPGLLAEILAGKQPRATTDIANKDIRQPSLTLAQTDAPAAAQTERSVKVRIEINEAPADDKHKGGSGAQDVRLFRNGSLVKVFRGDVLKGQKSATLEATIPITAGENQLTAYAFNRDNIKSADAALVVTGAESLRRKGVLYLVAVGINTYANSQYNLKYAVADATEFSAEIKKQQARIQSYERTEVIALHNQNATKANLMQKLNSLAGLVRPEDAVVVYFAGHGTAKQNQFFLIPHDLGYKGARNQLTKEGLQTILEQSISDRELEQAFEKIDAGRFLLVIDACNSGQALEAEEKRRGPMNSKGLAQLAYEKGMYILTAAQSYQAAMEASRLGHGYLTYALVEEGLKKGAADTEPRDGTIGAREWLNYAIERVPQMQMEKMQQRILDQEETVAFVEGEEKVSDPTKRTAQRPRVFYRREVEAQPLIVAQTKSAPPKNNSAPPKK